MITSTVPQKISERNIMITMPTESQNNAKPTSLFKIELLLSKSVDLIYEKTPAKMTGAFSFQTYEMIHLWDDSSAESRISATSSSESFSSLEVNRSITSGTISRSFVTVS